MTHKVLKPCRTKIAVMIIKTFRRPGYHHTKLKLFFKHTSCVQFHELQQSHCGDI